MRKICKRAIRRLPIMMGVLHKDVTSTANWSVEPEGMASITAGLLTTERMNLPTDITLTAQYSEGENIQEAEKQASILTICPSGNALRFDGVNDYVNCGNATDLNITDDITISAWIYLDRGGNGF